MSTQFNIDFGNDDGCDFFTLNGLLVGRNYQLERPFIEDLGVVATGTRELSDVLEKSDILAEQGRFPTFTVDKARLLLALYQIGVQAKKFLQETTPYQQIEGDLQRFLYNQTQYER